MAKKTREQKKQEKKLRKAEAKKNQVKGKKAVIVSVILIITIFVIAQILYIYVIPRVTIDLKTNYHEATGGGGTGGQINVNTLFINSGTIEITNLKIIVAVFNATMALLTKETYENDLVSPGNSHQLKLFTSGNCFETFYIDLEVEFETSNNEYYEKFNYKTHEDAMNIGFEDNIFDWGF